MTTQVELVFVLHPDVVAPPLFEDVLLLRAAESVAVFVSPRFVEISALLDDVAVLHSIPAAAFRTPMYSQTLRNDCHSRIDLPIQQHFQ